MITVAFLLLATVALAASSSPAYYVTLSEELPNPAPSGSQHDPFHGLNSALQATQKQPAVLLTLIPSPFEFSLIQSFPVENALSILGNAQTLKLSTEFFILPEGSLFLSNVTIKAENITEVLGGFTVQGVLELRDCKVVTSVFVPLVIVLRGEVLVSHCEFVANDAVGVYIKGWDSGVIMEGVHVTNHTHTFVHINPSVGSGTLSFLMLGSFVANCRAQLPLFVVTLAGDDSHTGNVTLVATEFRDNAVPLFSLQLRYSSIHLFQLHFSNNSLSAFAASLHFSTFQLLHSTWENNSAAFLTVTTLTGSLTLENLTLSTQTGNGLLSVTHPGDPSSCMFLLINSTVRDIHYNSPGTTSGLLRISSCTTVLSRLVVSDVQISAKSSFQLIGLIAIQSGLLLAEHFWANNSGTSAYFLSSISSTVILTNFTLLNGYFGGNLAVVTPFSSLHIKNATFQDCLMGLPSATDTQFSATVLLGWTGASVLIEQLTIGNRSMDRYGACFVSSTSTFQFIDLRLDNVVTDTLVVMTSSRGSITNLFYRQGRIRQYMVQLFGVSRLQLDTMIVSVQPFPWIQITRGLFCIASNSWVNVTNSIIGNTALDWVVLAKHGQFIARNMTIENSRFEGIVGNAIRSDLRLHTLLVLNCELSLGQSFQTHLSINASEFRAVTSRHSFLTAHSSWISLHHVVFTNCTSVNAYARLLEKSCLILEYCTLKQVSSAQGTIWQIRDGKITVENSNFAFIEGSVFQAAQSSLLLSRCNFKHIHNHFTPATSPLAFGGVLGCVDCPAVKVLHTVVLNASAVVGGALSFTGGKVYVENCTFRLCSASSQGGVLFLESGSFEIYSSVFRYNKAGKSGGVLDLKMRDSDQKQINNSVFEENSALEGGAARWRSAEPNLSNVSFLGNLAAYGPDVASYAHTLTPTSLCSEAVSGRKLPLTFELRDHYGARVSTESNLVLRTETSEGITYGGNQVAIARNGLFHFKDLALFATPNTTKILKVSLLGQAIAGNVTVHFRPCVSGEIARANLCEYCNRGNVSYFPADSECTLCPAGATCYGGANMSLASGFWRSASNSTRVLSCPLKSKCLGGPDHACVQGFCGKFCIECAADYYRFRVMECEKCGSTALIWLQLAVILICLLGFMWAVLRWSLFRPDSYRLFVLKSLLHHAQLLSTLAFFKVTFSSSVQYLFKAQAYLSSFMITNLPIACFGYHRVEFFKAVIGSLLLPMFCLCSLLFAVLYRSRYTQAVAVLLSSFLLFAPAAVLQTLVPLLACEEVDSGEVWQFTDMREQCWRGSHLSAVYCVVLPSALVNLIIPLLAGASGYSHSKRFGKYFPMWRAGQRMLLWDLFYSLEKCVCLGIMLYSISYSQFDQACNGLLGLGSLAFLNVVLQRFAYQPGPYFTLAELSALIAVTSLAVSCFYLYNSPENSLSDGLVVGMIYGLNSGFVLYCLVQLVKGSAKTQSLRVLPGSGNEELSPGLRVPNNSISDQSTEERRRSS